jgi:diaminohydroxyphosphoribosylaminopyrimidine deaminase/5-amino-6-(5-phosphoribosylamino)uracil reductase
MNPLSERDFERLVEALTLAEAAIGLSDPNPRVGCVIGGPDGGVLGRGHTQEAGGAHAEVMALREAQALGNDLQGATAWVTLEPCAHHGRTPPCCDALIEAGLGRVVVAIEDPYPAVAGAGIARMRQAGMRVDLAGPDIAARARELNIGFFSRVLRARPWVRLKVAASLDGRTGLDNGISQWITGAEARADGHVWRRRASAVLTGIGTVLADDPRLDVRLVPSARQPLRVVVDSTLRTPDGARLLAAPGQVLLVTAGDPHQRRQRFEALGVEVLTLPGAAASRVDLEGLLAELAARGVNELHVEAGAGLTTTLVRAGLVDELLAYVAPRLLGGRRGIVDHPALHALSDSADFVFTEAVRVGTDLRLRLRPARAPAFGPRALAEPVSESFTAMADQN